jgi:ketosteroid isomerase-like protein
MIADRVCFVQDFLMKRLRLVSMLERSALGVGSPHHANVESFEKYETQFLPAPSRFDFTSFCRGSSLRSARHRDRVRQSVRRPRRKKVLLYLADDAQFLGRRNTMRGKQEVIAGWSEFFKPAVAPFRWQPERVITNAAGDLGFSSGPVFDEAGVQIGTFTSTWIRQPDGSWKIVFDRGSACPTAKQSAP